MATLSLKKPSARFQQPATKPAKPGMAKVVKSKADKISAAMEWLTIQYPELFNPDNPKPLAIGTGKEITRARPENISGKSLRQAIAKWTQRPEYIQAIATGDFRYRLDATPAGAIADQHRAYARTLIEGKGKQVCCLIKDPS